MNDDTANSKSEEEEVIAETASTDVSETNEQMIPKSRLDKVISQREEALSKLSGLEEEVESLKSLKDEIAELRESVNKKNEDDSEAFTKEEEDALEKIDKGLKGRGYVTKEELQELRRIDTRSNEVNRLSDKYKKGSGFPEFKTDEVLVYAKKKGFGDNLEAAYRDLHWEAIKQVYSKGGGIEPPDSEKPTGGEREKGTQTTTSQILEMDPNEYEKNRDSIFQKFRKGVFGK